MKRCRLAKLHLKHGTDPDSAFLKDQLTAGIKVEMEHTGSKSIAKQIAKAHLAENPKYYSYLSKMERSMK